MMSDDSENDGIYVENYENDIYYKKYKLLLERCEAIQKYNERLVYRIQEVKKIAKHRYDHVRFMKERLSKEYGEDWKVIPSVKIEDEEEDTKPSTLTVKIKEEKVEEYVEEKPKLVKRATKRKATRPEKDPNAPKRPSNPFFQFCQEQRQILMEQINSELKPDGELWRQNSMVFASDFRSAECCQFLRLLLHNHSSHQRLPSRFRPIFADPNEGHAVSPLLRRKDDGNTRSKRTRSSTSTHRSLTTNHPRLLI